MHPEYLEKILKARVYDVAIESPLEPAPLLSARLHNTLLLKREDMQPVFSFKLRGAYNKMAQLPPASLKRGVIAASAGNHAQGVALAAKIHGIRAVVCMAANATPSKIEATKAYGAEVVLHGSIWDEANERAKQLVAERGYTYIHPFDDEQLMMGQGTVGLEIVRDWPDVDVIVVPIGGGGLISGITMAAKSMNPGIRIIGVESSGAPGMKRSVEEGHLVTLDRVDCIIDGLRVKRVGEKTFDVVRQYVDEVVALPDEQIFDAVIWTMHHAKLVPEGAAAAPVAALLHGLIKAPAGSKVVAVLSGGNVNLGQLKGLKWN
jgi:threonine dehydratase